MYNDNKYTEQIRLAGTFFTDLSTCVLTSPENNSFSKVEITMTTHGSII